jgi:hypothetical protein
MDVVISSLLLLTSYKTIIRPGPPTLVVFVLFSMLLLLLLLASREREIGIYEERERKRPILYVRLIFFSIYKPPTPKRGIFPGVYTTAA